MATRLTIDRFEGDGKTIAVLVTDDGDTVTCPRSLLPGESQAGDVLQWSLEPDPETTADVKAETQQLQARLRATDPGGDVAL